MADLIVVGGGLAGSEAAWQAAERSLAVDLYEMRPGLSTGAHITPWLAELVCSNSLGSMQADRAPGVLKAELLRLGSLLIRIAEECALPAGGSLAVDREVFARRVTGAIESHPRIRLVREEIRAIPDQPAVIASGPLTSAALAASIQQLTGDDHLYFYDAIAPIVEVSSVNFEIAFRASRYGRSQQAEGDYINCPMDQAEYEHFVAALLAAERIQLKDFERELEHGVTAGADEYFEGCLPVEVLARRGVQALAYGPLRPVGLTDPRTGRRPYAVVQLRQDNVAGTLYNLVGFQTNLTFSEQKRVLRMIPGLEQAEFVRYGQMHRNTFIYSPGHLQATLEFKARPGLFFAGQITGAEGYAGNIATGLLAGINAARRLHGAAPAALPPETMLGALCAYITQASRADFQPMKANFGLLPPLASEKRLGKKVRYQQYATRAGQALEDWIRDTEIFLPG
jgi:methylenetetrahydrofolate--tRNA-(uracil-5-)-methyltransferase